MTMLFPFFITIYKIGLNTLEVPVGFETKKNYPKMDIILSLINLNVQELLFNSLCTIVEVTSYTIHDLSIVLSVRFW